MIIMMISNMSTSYFHKNLFHYPEDYLMMKLTLSKVYNLWFDFFLHISRPLVSSS